MRILSVILVIATLLAGCGAGSIINPQPAKYPIEATSTSANPGTLEAYNLATNYGTDVLKDLIRNKICLPETPDQVCSNNITNLQTDFNFNLDQITGGNNVMAYTIQYNTPGVKNENRSVSGGVLIPQVPESQIKGIVLYFHGTKITKYDVPSCFEHRNIDMNYCLGNSSDDGEVLGGILASQGYIVIMPDYVGQGFDSVVMHPYVLYPLVNAISGLNMIIATKALFNKLSLQIAQENFYITGFSEGGAYALWTSSIVQDPTNKFLENNQLMLKDTVGLSGAYDLKDSQLPMETENLILGDQYNIEDVFTATAAKPLLLGYLLSSYGFYDLDQTYTSLMRGEFLDCRTCLISGNSYTIPDLFAIHGNPEFNDPNLTLYLTSAAATTGYGVNGDNSAKALIQTGLLENQQFLDALTSNSINTWPGGHTPLGFVYLSKDSVVTNLNSINMYSQAATDKTAIVVDTTRYQYVDQITKAVKQFDHLQSNVLQLIAALQQFNRYP
jgi:hypothetical protein